MVKRGPLESWDVSGGAVTPLNNSVARVILAGADPCGEGAGPCGRARGRGVGLSTEPAGTPARGWSSRGRACTGRESGGIDAWLAES